jgi:hypothetical protein
MENETPKKSKVKPEMLLAVFAILISMSTLMVYIYQSNLMKQQQKMSVWPYLAFGPSWGVDYFILNMTNKGIGPAIIEKVRITYNDKELKGVEQIMSQVPDSLYSSFAYSSIYPGLVVMAGENVNMLKVEDPRAINYILENILTGKLLIEICYSSVYSDTWISSGFKVEEGKCK